MPPQWNTMGLPHLGWWIWSQSQPVAKNHPGCTVVWPWNWAELIRTGDWHFFEVENVTEISKSANIYSVNVLANWTVVCQKLIFTYLCVCVCVCLCVSVCLCVCISFRASCVIRGFGLGTKWTCQGLLFKKQDKSDTENMKTDIFLHSFPHIICYLTLFYIKKNFKLSTWILLFTFILCDASFMCKYTHIWAFLGLRQ